MDIYVINVCVPTTQESKFYRTVAINPYPMVITGSLPDLRTTLSGQDFKKWMGEHIYTDNLWNKAELYIRKLDPSGRKTDMRVPISEYINKD